MAESELPSPPFLSIPGLPNFRDVGGYPINASGLEDGAKHKVVRRGLVFRSSEPSKVTDDGVTKLQDLGIEKVFDLRSAVEIENGQRDGYGWKVKEWDGASREFVPVFLDQDYSPESLALRYRNYSSEHAEVRIYYHVDLTRPPFASKNSGRRMIRGLDTWASMNRRTVPAFLDRPDGWDRVGGVKETRLGSVVLQLGGRRLAVSGTR